MNQTKGQRDYEEDFLLDDDDEDAQANKYLLFKIADEVYGIDIKFVTEIIELQKITEVPDMPDYVKGVINLRGKVIPVVDVRLRFKMPARDYDDRTCIIVVNVHGTAIGFVVDTVAEVQDIPAANIEQPPHFRTASGHDRYISGLGKVGEDVRILLDVSRMLYEDEAAELDSMAKADE